MFLNTDFFEQNCRQNSRVTHPLKGTTEWFVNRDWITMFESLAPSSSLKSQEPLRTIKKAQRSSAKLYPTAPLPPCQPDGGPDKFYSRLALYQQQQPMFLPGQSHRRDPADPASQSGDQNYASFPVKCSASGSCRVPTTKSVVTVLITISVADPAP